MLITAAFCGFLGMMSILYLLLPKQDFSEKEKRYLAEQPVISWETLLSGELGDQIEDYMSDHIPGRNFFVGVNAYGDLILGKQSTKDVRLLQNDRIVESPVKWNQQIVGIPHEEGPSDGGHEGGIQPSEQGGKLLQELAEE